MKKELEYIILTPIAPHKRYSLDRFVKNVAGFVPAPKKIVFCCEPEDVFEIAKKKTELDKKGIELVIFTLKPETLKEYGIAELGRIRDGRNILRSFFLLSEFEWALLLDSDIIPKEKTNPSVLYHIAEKNKALTVINRYPGREDGLSPWSGVAFTLMHRSAANLVDFQVSPIVWEGEEIGQLSEDFTFLSILRAGSPFIEMKTGWKSYVVGEFTSMIHEIDPGVDKLLEVENDEFNQSGEDGKRERSYGH